MKTTYRGSCHCNAVQFEAELDLEAGTMRCNCGFCRKARLWLVFARKSELRVLQGEQALQDYQYTPAGMSAPFLHLTFCRHCGIRPFTRGGELPRFGGEFYAVNVACLELSEQQLAALPVGYADGRNGDWNATPALHGYL